MYLNTFEELQQIQAKVTLIEFYIKFRDLGISIIIET